MNYFDTRPPDWVISDTHFGHANILNYCPWRSTWANNILDHDEKIIAHWKSVVKPTDIVLHLGDFSLSPTQAIAAYRAQLPGKIILVRGNHDRSRAAMISAGFDIVTNAARINYGGKTYLCRHDPASFGSDNLLEAFSLFHGHCHGNGLAPGIRKNISDKAVDCSLDALHSIAPVKWSDLAR